MSTLLERRRRQFFRAKTMADHNIDTERLRCSCGAPMCFQCGWCSGQCECPKETEAEKRFERMELDYHGFRSGV